MIPSIRKSLAVRRTEHSSVQKRGFLFFVVPLIGTTIALGIGFGITLYGMEKYRKYQIKKDNEAAAQTRARMIETVQECNDDDRNKKKSSV